MQTGRLSAVLWDLDGTLVNSEPAHDAAFRAAMDETGLRVAPDFHDRLLGVGEDGIHAELVALSGMTLSLPEWRALKWRYYSQMARDVRPLAGIPGVLDALQAAAVPMAVVSNSTRAEVDLLLGVTGLAPIFGVTVSRSDLARGKPEPEGYLAAARLLGQRPDTCVVIEDSPTGARAGVAAGMVTVYRPETGPAAAQMPAGALYLAPDGDLGGFLGGLGVLPG